MTTIVNTSATEIVINDVRIAPGEQATFDGGIGSVRICGTPGVSMSVIMFHALETFTRPVLAMEKLPPWRHNKPYLKRKKGRP